MAYSYSWQFPTMDEDDSKFIEDRWARYEQTHWKIVIKGSWVSWGSDLSTLVKAFSVGYRYNIGKFEIECLVEKQDKEQEAYWDNFFNDAAERHGHGRREPRHVRLDEHKLMEFLQRLVDEYPKTEPYSPVSTI